MSQRLKGNAVDSSEEDDNGEDNYKRKGKGKGKGKLLLFGGCNYKRVVLSPFNKFQRFYKKYKRSSPSYSSSSSNSTSHQVSNFSSSNYSCCLCMSKPQTLDTDFEGIDPNNPNVSYDYIKSLIEKNDFYCKECNTHFYDSND